MMRVTMTSSFQISTTRTVSARSQPIKGGSRNNIAYRNLITALSQISIQTICVICSELRFVKWFHAHSQCVSHGFKWKLCAVMYWQLQWVLAVRLRSLWMLPPYGGRWTWYERGAGNWVDTFRNLRKIKYKNFLPPPPDNEIEKKSTHRRPGGARLRSLRCCLHGLLGAPSLQGWWVLGMAKRGCDLTRCEGYRGVAWSLSPSDPHLFHISPLNNETDLEPATLIHSIQIPSRPTTLRASNSPPMPVSWLEYARSAWR